MQLHFPFGNPFLRLINGDVSTATALPNEMPDTAFLIEVLRSIISGTSIQNTPIETEINPSLFRLIRPNPLDPPIDYRYNLIRIRDKRRPLEIAVHKNPEESEPNGYARLNPEELKSRIGIWSPSGNESGKSPRHRIGLASLLAHEMGHTKAVATYRNAKKNRDLLIHPSGTSKATPQARITRTGRTKQLTYRQGEATANQHAYELLLRLFDGDAIALAEYMEPKVAKYNKGIKQIRTKENKPYNSHDAHITTFHKLRKFLKGKIPP